MKRLKGLQTGLSTPKVFLTSHSKSINLYSMSALRHLCNKFGVNLVDCVKDADFIWVSICDVDDLNVLIKLREQNPEKPIVMGGFESYFAIPYFAWVDYVVVGEGYDFIKAWGEDYNKALNLDCVMKSENDKVTPSYNIVFKDFPLVKLTGRNRFYYLSAKGCKRKCKFCATSWIQPLQEVNKHRLKKVVNCIEKKKYGKITLITNDSNTVIESKAVSAQSVRVEDYIIEPLRYKANMLHFGIEGWSEKERKDYGKPIKDENIRKLIKQTKEHKQTCELFFIVGKDDWSMKDVEKFTNILPADSDKSPKMIVKLTYFDPIPHTPYHDKEINLNFCDTKRAFKVFSSKNTRIRVLPTRSMARSAFRGVFHRCNPDEAIRLGKQPDDTNKADSFDNFKLYLKQNKLLHRLKEPNEKYENYNLNNKNKP